MVGLLQWVGVPVSFILSRFGKTGRDTAGYVASKFTTRILTLCLLPVWTSLLSPTQYGMIGTLGAWGGILAPIVLLGLPSSLIRFCPESLCDAEERHRYLSTAGILIGIAGMLMLLVTFSAGPWIWGLLSSGNIPFYPFVPMIVVTVFLGNAVRLLMAERLAIRDVRSVITLEQLSSTGMILASLFGVAALGWGVYGYILGGLVMSGVTSLFLVHRYVTGGVRWDPKIAKVSLAYGLPLVPQALAAWLLNFSDRVIIERYHPLAESGYYNLASNFGMVMSFLAVSISQATTPGVFAAMSEPTPENRRRIRMMGFGTLGLIAVCAIGMMVAAPPVLGLLAHTRFSAAIVYVIPVVAGFFLFGVYQMFLRPMLYLKHTKTVAAFTIIAAALNVTLNLIYVPSGGAMAAALTTAVSYFVAAILSWLISRRLDDMGLGIATTALLIAIPLASAIVLGPMGSAGWGDLLARMGIGVLGVVAVAAICWRATRTPLNA